MRAGEAKPAERAKNVEIGELDPAAAFASGHQRADGFNVMKTDGAEAAANPLDRATEQSALDGEGKTGNRVDIDEHGFGRRFQIERLEAGQFRLPVIFFGARPIGGGRQNVGQRRD